MMKVTRGKKKPRGKVRRTQLFDSPNVNVMLYQTSWTTADLSSSTAGVIASTVAPSIQNSSEYSSLQSFFRQIKLKAFQVIVTCIHPSTRSVDQTVIIGTDMQQNETTVVTPSTPANVENHTNVKFYSSSALTPLVYNMPVPANLEYAGISADAPSPETPWAGSPGAILIYGSGFTPSLAYFRLHLKAVYVLRGRT